MEDRTWLPIWATRQTREGLTAERGCRCSEFCYFYATGEGDRPSIRDVCPLYFRDRPKDFTGLYSAGVIDFLYLPWHAERTRSLFIRFDDDRSFFRFGRKSETTNDIRLEVFTLFCDSRSDLYDCVPRRPLLPANFNWEMNLVETLENLLNPILIPGVPPVPPFY